jgi:hypothetical protein
MNNTVRPSQTMRILRALIKNSISSEYTVNFRKIGFEFHKKLKVYYLDQIVHFPLHLHPHLTITLSLFSLTFLMI